MSAQEVYIWPKVPETREQVFPGVVIEGFSRGTDSNLGVFDRLLVRLARIIAGKEYTEVRFPSHQMQSVSDVITGTARTKRLLGQLEPVQAIILPINEASPLDINLMLETAARASGKGIVATVRHRIELPVQRGSSDYTFYARSQVASRETDRSIQAFLDDL